MNKNIYFKTVAALLAISALMTACGQKKADFVDTTQLQQYKTEYVGDAANVSGLVSSQQYPKGYAYDHIEIQSDTEPYGLKVYLTVAPDAVQIGDELQVNADTAFDLIGNLGTLDYVNAESMEAIASYERSEE